MADTTFVDQVTTVTADWLNDVNDATYNGTAVFTPTGTGAVVRTTQDKLRDFTHVKDFGAVGDGITNDTAFIQAALNSGAGVVYLGFREYLIDTLSIPDGVELRGQGKSRTTLKCRTNATAIAMNNVNDASLVGVLIIAHATQTNALIAVNATTQTVTRCRIINIQCSGSATDFPFISLATAGGAWGNWAHLFHDLSVSGCGTIFRAETTFALSWINSINMSHIYANDFIRGVHILPSVGEGCSDSTFLDWNTQTSARTQFGALIADVGTQGYSRKNSFHDVRWYDLINGGGLAYSIGANVLDTSISGLVVDDPQPLRYNDRGINTRINGLPLFESFAEKANRGLQIPTNAGLTSAVSGTGTTASLVPYVQLRTGATGGSLARRYSIDPVSGLSQNQLFNTNFSLPFKFSFLLTRITTGGSAIGRVQFKRTQADGSLAAPGLGIQVNNYSVFGESYNSALATVNLGITLVDAETYKVEILHYPGLRVEWWVNGVFAGEQTTLTSVPSGLGACYFHSSLANVAANDVQMFINDIEVVSGI